MTVLDHMKAAGYDPNAARNADDLRRMGAGTMECESMPTTISHTPSGTVSTSVRR